MAFFDDNPAPVVPAQAAFGSRNLGAISAVLKYAPRRLRPETGDAAATRAQADARYWRERAFKAETRLRALETRVQNLAARAQTR